MKAGRYSSTLFTTEIMDSIIGTLPISNPVLIFFIVLAIILFAPLIFNRLRIPHIIGLIIAGIIIGPYGFNILARDSSFQIFGSVGVLYLMFLAGLEMDMYDFKKNKKEGLVFGLYTFLVPMVCGTLISYYTLHLNWITAILLASMYASHTLIAYPLVSRYGVSRSRAVTITISGTIITVLGALIILAIIIGMEKGELGDHFLLKMISYIAIYCLAIIYSYPRIARWFLKKYNDNVTQFIFVLALVFLASYLAELIGLEPILGAFLAGLVLNRYIPNVSPLMNRLEFVGNAIFIPYFLIGVGMLIDLRVVFSSTQAMIVAVNMSLVATGCKWIAAWLTQKTFHYSAIDRKMIFGLSNAQAAATLAAVIIGHEVGLLDDNILNGTIIMILVTCTISSIVTERAAQKMLMQMQEEVVPEQKNKVSEERILIPVANPLTINNLINLALLMKNPKRRSPLFAVHVTDDNKARNLFSAKSALESAAKVAAAADTDLIPIARYDMNITSGIIHTIKERNITEVVMGLHYKANIVDTFFGSKIESLLKATTKMVMITRCIIPINTITRILIVVPRKAEYETGFAQWIDRIANIAKQIGCRAIFYAHTDTIPHLQSVIRNGRYNIRSEYEPIGGWDDFILLSNEVLDDDLFVIVNARRSSVSFHSEQDNLPSFLGKYFVNNNLVVLYPEQFAQSEEISYFSDPLANDVQSSTAPVFHNLQSWFRKLINKKKKWTHRNRKNKIEI